MQGLPTIVDTHVHTAGLLLDECTSLHSGEYFQESSVAVSATHGRPPTKTELRTQHVLVRHPSSTMTLVLSYTGFSSSFSIFCQDDIPYHGSGLPPSFIVGLYVVLCAMACAWYIRTKQTSGPFHVSHSDGGGTDKTFSDSLISNTPSEV